MATSTNKGKPVASGNMGEALDGLLKSFGVANSETNDGVRRAVEELLKTANLSAEVLSLRYGKLTLKANPLDAQMLRFEKDNLLNSLEKHFPGEVTSIIVRTGR